MNQRVVIMTTSPKALRGFFQEQIRFLLSIGFDVQTISSPGEELDECRHNIGVPMHAVAMERRISPFADLSASLRLCWELRRLRPAIVHTHTPKAGLLGMIAATLARVPVRIYTINGLRFSTCSGLRRAILFFADKLACSLATQALCVSESLRQEAVAVGVCPAGKVRTLGYGGSHGVDANKFDPDRRNGADRERTRSRYGLPQNATVLGYVGRMVHDKGIADLYGAWRILREECPNLWLFLCGGPEAEDPLEADVMRGLWGDPRVRLTGETVGDMPAIYAALDICVLPSYREGLPNVMLEAQAMRVPVVGTRINGTVDAVRHGVTGFLVETRNPAVLAQALRSLIEDGQLRSRMGAAGRAFVSQHFHEQRISELVAAEYRRLLAPVQCETIPSRCTSRRGMIGRRLKRIVDVLGGATGLIVASPVMLLVGIAVRRSTRSTAIFRQERGGLRGRPFPLYKFRTMTEARDAAGCLLPDAQRLTALGRALRATSLDELPQLWNVVRGDMSLVGPRPLIVKYVPRYNSFQARRHDVRPGITGWAQVNGRNALSWEEHLKIDVWYVENWSVWLDVKVMWMTIWKVFRGEGISHAGDATMPEFHGEHQ